MYGCRYISKYKKGGFSIPEKVYVYKWWLRDKIRQSSLTV